ncbi:hypothetical protein ARNL5_00770 [Anaerolineae bacterium]|nr:hypothetical protein ARNL5_00770 [Anaerolineae bacterium]
MVSVLTHLEQSVAHEPGVDALSAAQMVLKVTLPHVLSGLLSHHQRTRSELYEYIFARGCDLDQATMYRYFNPNPSATRLPAGSRGKHFLTLFGDFLELSPEQRSALTLIWQVQRQQRRKNGAGRID